MSGLHAEEEPADRKALEVRSMLKDVAKTQVNQASSLFREACALFKPVFRYCHFSSPSHHLTRALDCLSLSFCRSGVEEFLLVFAVSIKGTAQLIQDFILLCLNCLTATLLSKSKFFFVKKN